MKKPASLLLLFILFLASGAGCTSPSSPPLPTGGGSPHVTEALSLSVASLPSGTVLPEEYTCKGEGRVPVISWAGSPEKMQSYLFVLDDPDAPDGLFTHWIVFNIPNASTGLPGGTSAASGLPAGAVQGGNSAGTVGYVPPCPPVGSTHRYVFHLYALDTVIQPASGDRAAIAAAVRGHVIAKAEVTDYFGR